MATEEDILKMLRYMAAAWPRFEMSEQTVAVYVMHMMRSRLAAEVLLLAAMNLVDTQEFFPSVATWREEARDLQCQRELWHVTGNYREHGQPLPDELQLPPGMGMQVLGYEPALLEAGEMGHEGF